MAASGILADYLKPYQHIFACYTLSIGRAEVLANMDDAGSAYTSKDMFAGCKSDVDFVQVRRNSPAGLNTDL